MRLGWGNPSLESLVGWSCLVVALAALGPTPSLAADIELSVVPGVNPGELQLFWTGGVGPFHVHRSFQASSLVSAATFIAVTSDLSYTDVGDPSVGEAIFYLVVEAGCGDGILDSNEQCDDANSVGGDGCSSVCRFEVCGNGVLDVGEQCDDANTVGGDGCSTDCRLEACGDGVLDVGEECDDGNTVGGDGCSASCRFEVCGNGILDPGEQCDDGNTSSGDGCSSNCQTEACGNGVIDPGEGCDDANTTSGDGCSSTCQTEVCGNGIIDPGEGCDDGNTAGGDGCSPACQLEACGNGVIDPGEGCDDGNTAGGDGCSSLCQVEACGNGVIDFGEQCDDANTSAGDGCSPTCQLEVCGNGVIDPGEQCDDANTVDGDGCSSTCQNEGTAGATTVDLSCRAPLFFAYQDGDGPWIPVDGVGGVYQFTLTSAKGAMAFVYFDVKSSSYVTSVQYLLESMAAGALFDNCIDPPPPATKMISGTALGLSGDQRAEIALGGGIGLATPARPGFSITRVHEGVQDLVGFRHSQSSVGTTDRALIRRDQDIPDGGSVGTLDFEGPESFAAQAATMALVGAGADETVTPTMTYSSGASCLGGALYFTFPGMLAPTSLNVTGIPADQQRASDLHLLRIFGNRTVTAGAGTSANRQVDDLFHTMADRTVTLPPGLTVDAVTSLGGAYKRLQADFTLPLAFQLGGFTYYDAQHSVSIGALPGFFEVGAGVTLAMPDFTGLTGWDDSWEPSAAATGGWTVQLTGYDPPYPAFTVCTEDTRVFSAGVNGNY